MFRKRVLLLTGAPGIGKTTLLIKVVDALKQRDVTVGGIISREVRENGVRIGFELVDLSNGLSGWLAHVNQKLGPKVGKYTVSLSNLDVIGATAIINAIRECEVIAIDEVGPMELFSNAFKNAVQLALDSSKPMLTVVHAKVKDPIITIIKQRKDAELFHVTEANRANLAGQIADQITLALK